MKTTYLPRFLRNLRRLKGTAAYDAIVTLVFETVPNASSLAELKQVKKLRRTDNYYRIRLGDYRIGFRLDGTTVVFMRVLHRKDIYCYFP